MATPVDSDLKVIDIPTMHFIVESALDTINADVAKSYRDYRNYKQDFSKMIDNVYKKVQSIDFIGDRSNANTDSTLVSTKRCLGWNELNGEFYKKFFLKIGITIVGVVKYLKNQNGGFYGKG